MGEADDKTGPRWFVIEMDFDGELPDGVEGFGTEAEALANVAERARHVGYTYYAARADGPAAGTLLRDMP